MVVSEVEVLAAASWTDHVAVELRSGIQVERDGREERQKVQAKKRKCGDWIWYVFW